MMYERMMSVLKNFNYSLVALVVALAMLISAFCPVLSLASDTNTSPDANHVRLLSALGIETKNSTAAVTRGDFANYILKTVKMTDVSPSGELPYDDVSPEDDFYNSVGVLYDIGVLSYGSQFNPERAITASEAAKIIVSTLGYDYVAQSRGGYPGGYFYCVHEMNIGIYPGMDVTENVMSGILYDMLCASPNRPFAANRLMDSDGPDGFLVYHNVSYVKGVITSNSISSIYSDIPETKNGYITLDGKRYQASNTLTDGKRGICEYLGCMINAYVYDKDNNEELIYFDTESAKILDFNTRDTFKKGLEIYKTEGNKDKKYNLSSGYSVIWNGKICDDFTDSDFSNLDSSMLLFDNDGDSKYDVVSIEKCEYIISESVNSLYKSISDKNKHTYGIKNSVVIYFDDPNCTYEYFMQTDSGIVSCSFEDFEKFNAFSVVMSKDNQYIRITALSNTISGKVTEFSNEAGGKVSIDGVFYDKTEYLNEHNTYIPFDTYVTAYLTEDNRLIYIESDESVMRYGYLMKIAKTGTFGEYSAAFLFDDGRKETVGFNDKFILDGERVNSDFANSSSTAYIKLFDKPQLVKYSLSKDGKFSRIDTASSAPSADAIYTDAAEGNPDDSLLKYESITELRKRTASYTTCFAPELVPRTVKIFSVPKILNTSDASSYVFDMEDFRMATIAEIPSESIPVAVYDISRNRDAGALVWYNSDTAGGLPVLGLRATAAIVDRIADSVNEDGTPVKKITFITQSGTGLTPTYTTALFSEDLQKEYDRIGYDIKPGEMVAIARSGNIVSNIKPLVSGQEWKVKDSDMSHLYSEYLNEDFCAKGTLLDFSDSVISVLLDDDDPDDGYDNSMVIAYPTMNLSLLMRFNYRTDTFEKVGINDLKTVYNSGKENADRILIRSIYLEPMCIGVYPKE